MTKGIQMHSKNQNYSALTFLYKYILVHINIYDTQAYLSKPWAQNSKSVCDRILYYIVQGVPYMDGVNFKALILLWLCFWCQAFLPPSFLWQILDKCVYFDIRNKKKRGKNCLTPRSASSEFTASYGTPCIIKKKYLHP